MIALEGLSYTYPQAERPALRDIDLHIPAGQFCTVVGANGAGKSTLSYILTGFIPHHYKGTLSGTARVGGLEVAQTELAAIAAVASLVFANPFNQITGARFTVREEIAFGLENLGVPQAEMEARVAAVIAQVGLEGLEARSPYALSGGQQQRLALASVLVMRPQLLVLDEPTAQLDPHGKREMFDVLHQFAQSTAMTVVLIEHELEWIGRYAERVVVLDEGQIVADGAPRQVLATADLLQCGVGNTRYTQAARMAQTQQLVGGAQPLPVTLAEATSFFTPNDADQNAASTAPASL